MQLTVGKASFCDYSTIQQAVDALEQHGDAAVDTLFILEGTYEETVIIRRSRLHIYGLGRVEIRMNRHARQHNEQGKEIGTFATATVFVGGSDLLLDNLIISNTAGQGADIGQAVALYAHCDRSVFRRCTLRAYQDTLFTGPLPPKPKERALFGGIELIQQHAQYRQLYEHCYIEGTIDFIFGGATAYFDQCHIHSLRHYDNQSTYITAASTPQGQPYGYVFHRCFVTGDDDIAPVYLGRPWREYAQTVWVECSLGDHIHPAGWDNWDNPDNEQTVDYREYHAGSASIWRYHRVNWAVCEIGDDKDWRKEIIFDGECFWNEEEEYSCPL